MTPLCDHTLVQCSPGETQGRLEAYFASLRADDGVARICLRVPIATMDGRVGLWLGRDVRVEARRDGRTLAITWEPEGRTVLPKFEGTLRVQPANGSSYIELKGEYLPPLGAAGQIFDELIGHRIAESTAREFLRDLKHAVERE